MNGEKKGGKIGKFFKMIGGKFFKMNGTIYIPRLRIKKIPQNGLLYVLNKAEIHIHT